MARGDGSIGTKKGTSKLYLRYYVDGPNGHRTQIEEATGTEDRTIAEKMLRERLAGAERKAQTQTEPIYLIDIPEAARRMSTTIFAVRELIRSRKLKCIVVGHKMLISPKAIEEFIAASEVYYGAEKDAPA